MPDFDVTTQYSVDCLTEGMQVIMQTHNSIDQQLDALEGRAEANLVLWVGQAREQYLVHKAGWDHSVDEMKRIMTENAVPALDRILQNYQTTEQFNSSLWNNG